MGTILPDNPADQLEFFRIHAPQWADNPAAVGLSDQEAARVKELTERTAAALAAANAAALAARNATQNWRQLGRELRLIGGHAVGTIKAYARTIGDVGVLAEAGLSVPKKPGPKRGGLRAGLPDLSDDFPRVRWTTASPDAEGNIQIEWSCGVGATLGAGPGVFYRLERQLDDGPIKMLDMVSPPGAGRRSVKYVDATVPFGTRTVLYYVTPVKGAGSGTAGVPARVEFGGSNAPRSPEISIRRGATGMQTPSATAA